MLIDKNGAISGTFELLPSTISSDNLQGSDLGVVTGPYLHFQELVRACYYIFSLEILVFDLSLLHFLGHC